MAGYTSEYAHNEMMKASGGGGDEKKKKSVGKPGKKRIKGIMEIEREMASDTTKVKR